MGPGDMKARLVSLLAAATLLGSLTPLVPGGPGLAPAAAVPSFGDDPLDAVLHWAAEERRCGLTTNKLAALMLAPTYPETGSPSGQAPSPMTLSRWDNQAGLHSFGTVAGQPRAFWHPGVGMWQFDSAGLGAPLTAAQSIDTYVVAAQTAATMAARWCTNPTLAYVWAPWYGCGSTTCRGIFRSIYRSGTDQLVGVARDGEVTARGGMVRRSCTGPAQSGTFTCWRIDPARAEGFAAFAAPGFGPAPITAPFYVYAARGREHRHWLKADTGYARGIWATRPLGSNARTSLSWHWGDGIVDAGPGGGGRGGGGGGGGGAGFRDIPPDAWYLEALSWGVEDDIVLGYDDGTFGPGGAVTRAQAVSWLWSLVGRPIAATDASFSDVAPGAWFADALDWAAAEGVVSGFPDGSFRPGALVNRAQLAAMLWNGADRPVPAAAAPFTDVRPAAWYAAAVGWLSEMGYASGFPGGAFHPAEDVKRAQGLSWLHAARPFEDVASGAWYEADVDWGRFRGVVAGYEDHTFRGDEPADRRDTVDMVWGLMGAPTGAPDHGFGDLGVDAAVSWAAAGGFVTGFPDTTFRPGVGVTRAQAVVMLWKVAGRPLAEAPPPYTDVSVEAWFAEAVSWAETHGIVHGFPDGTFRGGASVSRAQLTAQVSGLAHTEAAWAPGAVIPRTVVFAP